MPDELRPLGSWITVAGCVLVVAVLYWAQAILVPVALAILLTFVLTPPVLWLERRLGRVAAVLLVTVLVFTVVGLAGWAIYRQTASLTADLPTYRDNIRAKVHDVEGVDREGSVGRLQRAFAELQRDLGDTPKGTAARPVVVATTPVSGLSAIGWIGPLMQPVGTAGFVITLVIFMLLERAALRDRLLGLFGHGRLAVTTKALDEASSRVSRQLLLQTVVNLLYALIAIAGLSLLHVPYALFWGALGGALRFIPYVGPFIGASGPMLLSLAALPGWGPAIEVAAFYGALELFTNLVLETMLYAEAAGVSQVALLIAVAFWTWLWGPLGLLMAVPLTVCLVVVGKHVPGLAWIDTLLSDGPALTVESSYYQRLLARDQAEASDLMEKFIKTHDADTVYDAMLIPALNSAERDRVEGRLSADEEAAVVETTGDMIELLMPSARAAVAAGHGAGVRMLGYAANGPSDLLALRMLAQTMTGLPIQLDVSPPRLLASELVALVATEGYTVVCVADLPPSAPSKTRYLIKKLRAALPDVRIAVGRWAPAPFADDSLAPLLEAGASHASAQLLDTRKYLAELASVGLAA